MNIKPSYRFCIQTIIKSFVAFFVILVIEIPFLYGIDDASWKELYQKCVAGDCQNGKGTMIYYSTQKYIGEFKDGQKHGSGTMKYPDGRIYTGQFLRGQRTGSGTMTYPDGRKVTGEFLNGVYMGQPTD